MLLYAWDFKLFFVILDNISFQNIGYIFSSIIVKNLVKAKGGARKMCVGVRLEMVMNTIKQRIYQEKQPYVWIKLGKTQKLVKSYKNNKDKITK